MAVWVAVPLVVLNGRTVIGCGCTGEFQPTCHCSCCSHLHGGRSQRTNDHRSCCAGQPKDHHAACCDQGRTAQQSGVDTTRSHTPAGQTLDSHRCETIVLHEASPVTLVHSDDAGGNIYTAIHALADVHPLISIAPFAVGRAVEVNTGPPPNDLVVTLHRLVI